MTNPMFNPQPNYSGVTIQIANPAVNVGDCARNCTCGNNIPQVYGGYVQPNRNVNGIQTTSTENGYRQLGNIPNNNYVSYPQGSYALAESAENVQKVNPNNLNGLPANSEQYSAVTNPNQGYPNAYPAQYYLNNYNYGPNGYNNDMNDGSTIGVPQNNRELGAVAGRNIANNTAYNPNSLPAVSSYKAYAENNEPTETDFTRSNNIIGDIDERVAEQEKEKKNTKETKIVALTDEYIKSLENYLNNPNDEIRLMASKEVLKRLDEDKDRYNDAALNALLNKMMQDPSKLVRIASLSAFSSQLASGNDYTVKLLHDIQSNPNADKEDVLQAADILLKMSAGVEMKNIPIPEKKSKDNNKG